MSEKNMSPTKPGFLKSALDPSALIGNISLTGSRRRNAFDNL
jgi:hypothetical protein